ncbi:hypothetical protein RLPCCGM1_c3672 [Rhizobium leguminosarum bv. phaseoli CCGM1]|nr:hypothetical protein RLPCCGM1_c3672 [Rhizobium leguminosarum bv. phaseoli CCGM1]
MPSEKIKILFWQPRKSVERPGGNDMCENQERKRKQRI